MKTKFKEFNMVEKIKSYLLDYFDYESWEKFIDNQNMGDCQLIVASICREFKETNKVFGEIEVDEPSIYYDEEYDEEVDDYIEVEKANYLFTHHWIELNGEILDFSKGTLKNNIDWIDIYDVYTEKWRYK